MPTIPVQPKLISTEVPVVSTNPLHQAGVLGSAIEGAGNEVMREGFDLIGKMKEAEAVSSSYSAHAQDQIDSQDAYSDFKGRSKDGNAYDEDGKPLMKPDGSQMSVSEQYRDWADERFKSNQLTMPSKLAQQKYQQLGQSFFTGEMLKMGREEDSLRVNASERADATMLEGFSNNLVSKPDLNQFYQYANTYASAIASKGDSIYDQSTIGGKIQDGYKKLSEDLFKGAHNQVLAGTRDGMSPFDRSAQVDYWRQILNGDDGHGSGPDPRSKSRSDKQLPVASEMIDPDKKAQIDASLLALKKTASDLDMSEFKKSMGDDVAALQMGHSERVDLQSRFSRIDQLKASGRMSPEAAADSKASLVAAKSLGSLTSTSFLLAPESTQRALIDAQAKRVVATAQTAGGDASAGSKIEQEFRKQALEVIQKSDSAKQKDFPAYAETIDKSLAAQTAQLDFSNPQSLQDKGQQIQSAISKTQTYYSRNFDGDAPVVTQDRAYAISEALKNPMMSNEQVASSVKALRSAYGPYFPQLMSQMVDEKKLPASWKMAGFMGDSSTQDFISAIRSGKDVEKTFEAVATPNNLNKSGMTKAVNEKIAPWVSTMLSQNPGDPATARQVADLQAATVSHAMNIYAQDGGKMGATEAANRAVDTLLAKNSSIETYKSGWFGRSYTYMIPNAVGTRSIGDPEKSQIRQFVSDNSSGDGLKKLGAMGTKDQLEAISQNGRFSLAPNMQGYNYFYTDPKTNRTAVVGVRDERGGVKPLFVPLQTMMTPTMVKPKDVKTFGQVGGP